MNVQSPAKSRDPSGTQNAIARRGPGSIELIAVWAMAAFMSLAVFVTYSRFPVEEFYNVSREGLAGGASRALTFLNYPIAFIAIALIGIAFSRLYAHWSSHSASFKFGVIVLAVVAFALSLVAAVPGVVDQGNLDARTINAIPAIGVLLAVVLTTLTLRATGTGTSTRWMRWDRLRLGLTVVAVLLALPWILAEIGVYIGDIPLLGNIFMSRQIPAGETEVAVHLGDHHGVNGIMFLLAGMWLSRELWQIGPALLRGAVAAYVSLMMVYGSFIAAQDFWLEQIVKRGWTTVEIPNMVRPDLTLAWGMIVIGTAILTVILVRHARFEPIPVVRAFKSHELGDDTIEPHRREAITS